MIELSFHLSGLRARFSAFKFCLLAFLSSSVCLSFWLLHGWCHMNLLPSRHTFCVHHTSMDQFTVSLYAKSLSRLFPSKQFTLSLYAKSLSRLISSKHGAYRNMRLIRDGEKGVGGGMEMREEGDYIPIAMRLSPPE